MKKSNFKKIQTFLTTFGERAEKRAIQMQKNYDTEVVYLVVIVVIFLFSFFMYGQYRLDRLASQQFCERMQIDCKGDKK